MIEPMGVHVQTTVTNNRYLAKMLDLFSMGGFITMAERVSGNVVVGFACGALYLLFGDATGATWKTWFKLRVVDAASGAACNWRQSILRNAPWLFAPAMRMLANQAFEHSDPRSVLLRGAAAAISLVVVIGLLVGFKRSGRHFGDQLADTVVEPVPAPETPPAARS